MKLLEKWRGAHSNPEDGQLTSQTHSLSPDLSLEHGWWLTPNDWGVGISFTNDWAYGTCHFSVEIACLVWGATLFRHPPTS